MNNDNKLAFESSAIYLFLIYRHPSEYANRNFDISPKLCCCNLEQEFGYFQLLTAEMKQHR